MPHPSLSSLGIHVLERGWLSSNCILLLDDQPCLVDSGYHTHASQTLAWIRSLLKHKPLARLMNTHLHSDHCGGNFSIQCNFPHVVTSVPHNYASAVRAWDPHLLSFVATGQNCPAFRFDNTLTDQQTITLAGLPWQVHAAKGHDPDSIVLFQYDHGILISADALWENGFGVVFPELSDNPGFEDVARTLDLIESLSPRVVIPGHGSVFTDVDGALTRARGRLLYFQQNPDKHIRHALKVLIKFKLLEWQSVSTEDLLQWCRSTPHMEEHMPNDPELTRAWLTNLIDELVCTGALVLDGQMIHDH